MNRATSRRIRDLLAWIPPLVILLAALTGIGLVGYVSDEDYYGPSTGWRHLGDGLMFRCEGTTGLYRQDPAGSIDAVTPHPECRN